MCSLSEFFDTSPTIEEVDRRIQSLHNDIRTLEHYRNARFSTISKLPSEVLSIIFEYLALPPSAGAGEHRWRPYRAWLPVSQVSKHWRNVALDSPKMWGCIYTDTNATFANLLLERTKSSPLYLHSRGFGSTCCEATFTRVLERSAQLNEIGLECDAGQFQSIAGIMNAPVLESLSLKASFRDSRKARFSPRVEPGTVPPLRYLSLKHCTFELDVPFFSHLRTLQLCFTTLSVLDILAALGSMEYLEHLELMYAVGGLEEIPEDLIVHQPQLTRLVMLEEIGGLRLFSHLSCPNIQSIFVHVSGDDEPIPSLALVASALWSMIPTYPSPWKVHVHSYSEASIHIWPDPSSSATEAPFQFTVEYTSMIIPVLPTVRPAVLDFILDDDAADDTTLMMSIQALETVEELRVHHLGDLLSILSITPSNSEGNQPLLPLPSLKHIVFDGWGRSEDSQRKLGELGQLLAARSSMNARIETFKIRRSTTSIQNHEVKHLEPLVGTLDLSDH